MSGNNGSNDYSGLFESLKKIGVHPRLGSDPELDIHFISTGIPMLDGLFGGGLPRKRITEIGGMYSVGKTWSVLKCISAAQKQGLTCALIDSELKYNKPWAEKIGVDNNKLIVIQAAIAETCFSGIIELVSSNIDLVCVDSIGGMIPSATHDRGMDENLTAQFPRSISKGINKLLPVMIESNSALLFTNQIRSVIGGFSPGGPLYNYPGGKALEHACSIIARYRKGDWIRESQKIVGFYIRVMSEKNVLTSPREEIEFAFNYKSANIDFLSACIDEALKKGIIVQNRAMYTYRDKSFRGSANLSEHFSTNNKAFKNLQKKVYGNILQEDI